MRGRPGGGAGGGGFAACHPLVGAADQPVPAGDDQARRGEGDLAEFGVAAGVLAPQAADDVDRLLGGGGELQARVDGRAGVEAEVLGGEPAAQAAGEDLGDEGGGGAARLLAAEPAGHGGLVVPQVEAVFQAQLVHPSGEARVGEPCFGDERGEPAVRDALRGSFRHQLCGLLFSGPGRHPFGPSWNGVNLAARAVRTAAFAPHSSDRVRIDGIADVGAPPGRSVRPPEGWSRRRRTVAWARMTHGAEPARDDPRSPDSRHRRRHGRE